MMLSMPQVEAVTSGIGFGFANSSANQATLFVHCTRSPSAKAWKTARSTCSIRLYQNFQKIPSVKALPANPPAIPGLGSTGGFAIEIQDINNLGLPTLNRVGNSIFAQAQKDKQLSQVRIPTS